MKLAHPALAAAPVSAESLGDRHARRLHFLHRLAGIGMEKARALASRVTARVVDDFARVTKAIRIAILLRRRLEELGPQDPAAPAARALADTPRRAEPPDPPEAAELTELAELRRAVARAPRAERDRPERDIDEPTGDPWLDRDDDLELDTLPLAVLVARLCDILGVPFDPDLWAGADAPIGAEGPPTRCAPTRRPRWRETSERPLSAVTVPRPATCPSG